MFEFQQQFTKYEPAANIISFPSIKAASLEGTRMILYIDPKTSSLLFGLGFEVKHLFNFPHHEGSN